MNMIVYQSKILGKTQKEVPADAKIASHILLTRAGYINQLIAGVFSLLPLGTRVQAKIEHIIREAMHNIDAQEVLLPAMQPVTLWEESGRLETMDPPLFRFLDRHDKQLIIAPTHEEAITDLARKHINSYKDLPLSVFQIQTKFRNEMRASGGLLRVREFQMKDLYSFHADENDLANYYSRVRKAYFDIFEKCGLNVYAVEADSGSIGGSMSEEFSIESETGEDKVAICEKCNFAANVETLSDANSLCSKCGGSMQIKSCIENGHIFQLGDKYSKAMNAMVTDEKGQPKPLLMGCYGIGVGRLLASIVEVHHDKKGIIWPESVSPFDVHLIGLQESVMDKAKEYADKFSEKLDILFDDRKISPGQKFADADLIGIPTRIIVSEKTEKDNKLEIVNRETGKNELLDPEKILEKLRVKN